MPDIWVVKGLNQHLIPDDETGRNYLKGIKAGEPLLVTVKKPRNIKFHRKFFALLNLAFDNQDRYDDFEAFRKEVTMRAGYWQEHIHVTGQSSFTAKSISFSAMDELAFSELYQRAIDAIIKHFMPEADPEELSRAVDEVLSFA